jgi:hypothetical protein
LHDARRGTAWRFQFNVARRRCDPAQRLLPGVAELRQPLTRANVRRQGVFNMAKKSTAIRTTQRFETDAQQLSDASLARIRAYARRYVRAGGTMFLSMKPSDHDNHIGNVVKELQKDAGDVFEQALEDTEFSHIEDQARLSNLAGVYVGEHSDAAFLFGAFVGLEFAAVMFGQVSPLPIVKTSKRNGGGAR